MLGWPTSVLSICALSISPWFGPQECESLEPQEPEKPQTWGGFKL